MKYKCVLNVSIRSLLSSQLMYLHTPLCPLCRLSLSLFLVSTRTCMYTHAYTTTNNHTSLFYIHSNEYIRPKWERLNVKLSVKNKITLNFTLSKNQYSSIIHCFKDIISFYISIRILSSIHDVISQFRHEVYDGTSIIEDR